MAIRKILRLLSRTTRDRKRELDEEIETHLALRAADLEATGKSPQDARTEAEARFGDIERAKSQLYEAAERRDRRLTWAERIDDVRRDVKVSLRRMRAHKGRSALTLGIFALGIGLTTAMFTIVDNVLIRALPFPDSERLVELQSVAETGEPFSQVSMGNWFDWRRESSSLARTGLYWTYRAAIDLDAEVVRVDATQAIGSFFETLQLPMQVGRPFTEDDGQSSANVVVVSEGLWRRTMDADLDLSDRVMVVDGKERQVVGVVARGFEFPEGVDVWIPGAFRAQTGGSRNNINYRSIARLTNEVSLKQVEAELAGIANGIRERDPEGVYSYGVGVRPLREAVVAGAATNLRVLMGSVLVVLLIACANLMGLGFAQGRERADEVAVRLALGAGRRRLMQQFATEQLLLGLVGGAIGLALAGWGTSLAVARLTHVLPRAEEVALDWRVAGVCLFLSVFAGLTSGLLPAWRASSGEPAVFLSRARTVRGGRGMPGASLVVAEIAFTVLLLTGGALLVRSMGALMSRDLGFDAADVVTVDVALTTPEYAADPDKVVSYWTRMLAGLHTVPGVEVAAAGTGIPTGVGGATFIGLPDDPESEDGARYRVVSEGYFQTLGARLVEGRSFGPEDEVGSGRVVVVNQTMAERYWPGGSALGQTVSARSMESYWFGGTAPWLTVIGVVADIRQYGFEDDPRSTMFRLYRQIPQMATALTAVVRTQPGQSSRMVSSIREQVRSTDPSLAVEAGLLESRVRSLLAERQLVMSIILSFAFMALALASLGIYGLLAFAVATRTSELAIRAALGASKAQLVGMVLRGAVIVVLAGALLGALAVLVARGVLTSLLVDVTLSDPSNYLGVAVILLIVALIAVLAPALRAARMDPMDALRTS